MKPLLEGRRALVTGGSRGIGSAIALELAACGADIVLHYAGNLAAAESVAEKIISGGRRCDIVQADLSSPDEAKKLSEAAGDIDILISNASVQIKEKWEKITVEQFNTQINCNLLASMLLAQGAVGYMRAKKWGRIITVGSVQEVKPHPEMLVYSASKSAQANMVKSLALQLAADGITVNNISPGVIYTDRNVAALSDSEYAKKVTDLIPMRRYGEKEECAPIIRLLCSDEGAYITGQTIFVDGGKSIM